MSRGNEDGRPIPDVEVRSHHHGDENAGWTVRSPNLNTYDDQVMHPFAVHVWEWRDVEQQGLWQVQAKTHRLEPANPSQVEPPYSDGYWYSNSPRIPDDPYDSSWLPWG